MIKKEGNEWCVYKHDGKEKVKCYPSEEAAKAAKDDLTKRGEYAYYMDAASAKGIWAKVSGDEHPHAACVKMMTGKIDDPHAFCAAAEKAAAGTTPAERAAKKHALESMTLNGVEIFGTGTHNGDTYEERDLDDMIEAFQALDFKPPLKSGHSPDEPWMPALGFVANLRKQGTKLVADFVNMPKIVHDYIKAKRFNAVSSEVYWNLKRGKDTYRRALKAVALLGADIPAVAGLRPLHELFSAEAGEVHAAEAINLFSAEVGDVHTKGKSMTEQEVKELQDRVAASEAKAKEDAERIAKAEAEAKKSADAVAELTVRFEAISKSTTNLDDVRRNALVAEAESNAKTALAAKDAAEKRAKADRDARDAAENEAKANAERVAKLEHDARRASIKELVASCKIPSLRRFLGQYAEMATRIPAGEDKVYVQDEHGGKHAALSQLEEVIKLINSSASKLFLAYSTEDPNGRKADSPDMEVDRLTRKYMEEHKVKDYSAAMKAVLEANPDLKEAYAKRVALN